MGTRCPQCQAENPEQSNYCGKCGSRLAPAGDVQFTETITLGTGYKVLPDGKIFADKYAILGEIGSGGMGVVYKAEDIRLKRTVALKFMPCEFMRIPDARERFIREAQSAAALSHPNICTIHEVDEADGQPYIAMEFVSGESLRQKAAKGPLDSDTVVDIAAQVAAGLDAAHQRGIIHRDIKSANIMVTEKGQAKIMDFGLAKVMGESQLTKETMTIGTVAYMSPEQAQGEDLDQRTDIFSFGVVLYEILTGQLPFRGDRESIILHSIVKTEPKPLRQIKPDIRVELQKIIDRALKKKREDRYVSAAEMAVDLGKYLDARRAEEAGFFNLKSLAKRLKKPAYFIPVAAVLVTLGVFTYWLAHRSAQVRWARRVALPQIENFVQANDFTAAYALTHSAARYIPKDPKIAEYLESLTGYLTITTDPPSAQVFVKDYSAPDSAYKQVGLTPFERLPLSIGHKRFKIVKTGFETVERTRPLYIAKSAPGGELNRARIEIKLDPVGSIPPGMIRVQTVSDWPGSDALFAPILNTTIPALKLEDYLFDKFEVTNREYKKFMDDGGYRRPELWEQKFIREGKEIPWEEAMKSFIDKSGRPGPATWEYGLYPDGQDDFPVTGVSWYEAAAYAKYAGKSLPTVYHWRWAAGERSGSGPLGMLEAGVMVPLSNFSGKGLTRVGEMQGMSSMGAFDMAGNAKEWCLNETSDGKRGTVGGGWDEPSYTFSMFEPYSAWFRFPDLGFRCMKYITPSPTDTETAKPIPTSVPVPRGDLKPCSEELFQVYLKAYEYPKGPLNPKVEDRKELSTYTILEEVSFDPAYLGDRTGAYLFVPKGRKGPFQTVIHSPGGYALVINSVSDYGPKTMFDYLTKTGRAVILPIASSTFHRKWSPELRAKTTYRERLTMMVKDYMRTVDYLETRPEFDVGKLAYEGLSLGANLGAIIPAIDKRIKAIVLIGPELLPSNIPEFSQVNLAPRITAPVLFQTGKYDFVCFTGEEDRNFFVRLFGTPEKDKTLKLYEAGHTVWLRTEQVRDEIDFLDKYLGPVR